MTEAPRRLRRGTWVVLALILLGVVAGTIAVTYWRGVAARTNAAEDRREPRRREAELRRLEERVTRVTQSEGDSAELLVEARHLVERYPDYAEARALLAKLLLRADRKAEAHEQITEALRLSPDQAEAHFLAGLIAHAEWERHLGEARDDEARRWSDVSLRHFERASDLEPSNLLYKLHLAQTHFDRREFDRAQMLALQMTRADSTYHPAYALLSDSFARENKIVPAMTQIDHAIQRLPIGDVDGRTAYLRKKAALLRRDNRPDEAYQVLESLPPSRQLDPDVVDERALSWQMMRRPEKAAEEYERALAWSPRDWRLAAKAAEWRLKAGDTDAARGHVQTLRQINPRLDVIPPLEAQLP